MLVNLLYFLILSSGSVLVSSLQKRRFEEALPLTIFFIIMVQYLFGLLGALRAGAYTVFALSVLSYALAFIVIIRKKTIAAFVQNFFTPGFFAFFVLFMVLSVYNRNKLAYSWDEFSHWADVVKAMTAIDDLATNPLSQSVFKSYVPAMPLFQYNLQVFNQLIYPKTFFNEGYLYLSYQVATYALLIPAMRKVQWNRFLHGILIAGVIFILPSIFYSFFDTIFIDAYLGVLSGFSLYVLINDDRWDCLSTITFSLSLFTLTLTKDAGFAISIFLAALYGIKNLLYRKDRALSFFRFSALTMAVVLPKITWEYHLSKSGISKIFGTPISVGTLIQTISSRDPSDYRWVTFRNFWKAVIDRHVTIGNTNISMGYILLFALILGTIYVLLISDKTITSTWRTSIMVGLVLSVFTYLIGMCLMYMFKFSAYEAAGLASFDRYLNIYTTMLITAAWLLYIDMVKETGFINLKHGYVIVLLITLLPVGRAGSFLSGSYIASSRATRANYTRVSEKVTDKLGNNSKKVYIISQEDKGFDYWVLRYSIRPHQSNQNFTWSIGKPFYEGDIWTNEMTVGEWQKIVRENYDYVLLYSVNDYFIDGFSSMFTEPELINNNSLYWVDKDTGMLYLVD